jgi:copper chaperone CopZ
MKSFLKIIIGIIATVISLNASAQSSTKQTLKFKVYGNCERCKKTIEQAVDTKGVVFADWNQKTKILEITFKTDQITEDQLHEKIAASGYDTEKSRADDKVYNNLHHCCKYERAPVKGKGL